MWGLFVGGVLEPSTSVHVCRDHSQHPWALPSYALTPNSAAAEGRIALSLPTRPTRALSSQQEAVLLRMLPVTQELSFLILADSNGGGGPQFPHLALLSLLGFQINTLFSQGCFPKWVGSRL